MSLYSRTSRSSGGSLAKLGDVCSALFAGGASARELREVLGLLEKGGYLGSHDREFLLNRLESLRKLSSLKTFLVLVSILICFVSFANPAALLVLLAWPLLLWVERGLREDVEERFLLIVGYVMLDNLTEERKKYLERKLDSIAEQLGEKFYGYLIPETLSALLEVGVLRGEDVQRFHLELRNLRRFPRLLVFCVVMIFASLLFQPMLAGFGIALFLTFVCLKRRLEEGLRKRALAAIKLVKAKELT